MSRPLARLALTLGLLAGPHAALAQSTPADPPSVVLPQEDEAPPPPVVLRVVPPRFSWEFGFSVSYGMVPQVDGDPSAYAGFGLRGGWGRHFGAHRVGVGLGLTMEGPVAIRWAHAVEPQFLWDFVTKKGFYLGASVAPSLAIGVRALDTRGYEVEVDVGPMAALRIGYSQPYSMVARRFWVAVEPKFRYTNGEPTVIGSIVIGSGRGY